MDYYRERFALALLYDLWVDIGLISSRGEFFQDNFTEKIGNESLEFVDKLSNQYFSDELYEKLESVDPNL